MTIPEKLYRLAMANAYAIGGYDAGAQMYNYYPTSVTVFPLQSHEIEILPDDPAGSWGLAWYKGRNPLGQPRFSVRDDLLLNTKIAWHEAGHALEGELIARGLTEDYIRTKYWNWRGFDGTWWDAYLDALTKGTSGGWAYLPGESIAESLSAATGGYVESEWTMNYGRDLARLGVIGGNYSPAAGGLWARDFWSRLCTEVDMDEATVDRIATARANEAMERYAAVAGASDDAIKGLLNFHDHDAKLYTSANQPTDFKIKVGGPNKHDVRPTP